ncbi:MAG: HesB/IscA family protein [Solirubrobacteraceae bacterium]
MRDYRPYPRSFGSERHGYRQASVRCGRQGSTIDYEESLRGAGFKVNNPNVVAACGCGSSFRVAEQEQVSAV